MRVGERSLRSDALAILRAAVAGADPRTALLAHLSCDGHALVAGDVRFDLPAIDRLLVVGFGKAGAGMAAAVEDVLGERIDDGVVIVPRGMRAATRRIRVIEAEHPLPGAGGRRGAAAVAGLADRAGPGDLVVVLISGGGSALLADPAPGLDLEDCVRTGEVLLASGAPIEELNAVRKHLSELKGGQLQRRIAPARSFSLLVSDVTGDDPGVIASGPTAPDRTTYGEALRCVTERGIAGSLPPRVLERLERGARGELPETPGPGDPVFEQATYRVIASNAQSLAAARDRAEALGYHVEIHGRDVAGEAAVVGRELGARLRGLSAARPTCLLAGGETTVTLGDVVGEGGRNQELALSAAFALEGTAGRVLLSAGTDGIDGPTDAAGGLVDGGTLARARREGRRPEGDLAAHNARAALAAAGDLIITGPTGTNVRDVQVMLAAGC